MIEINTTESRIKFVKGTTGTPSGDEVACGDGTAYPMLATLNEVAEIFYRVRDAWFTAGSSPGDGVTTKNIVGTPSDTEMCYASTNHSWSRGYCAGDTIASTNPYFEPFPAVVWDVAGGLHSSMFTDYSYNGIDFYDMRTDSEFHIWMRVVGSDDRDPDDWWSACAFNHYIYTGDDTSSTYGFDYSSIEIWLKVSGIVAYTGDKGPFDPDATLYIGVDFFMDEQDGPGLWSQPYGTYGFSTGPVCDLIFKLSNSEVRCQLYSHATLGLTSSDFVLTAKRWWPYSKGGGFPAWDIYTGAQL